MQLPFTQPFVWPNLRPSRFASSIRTERTQDCELALLGLPDDTGVKLNHGRPGAQQGPAAFRRALASFGTHWDGVCNQPLSVCVFDAGNIVPALGGGEVALFETHRRVEAAVLELHKAGLLPVCIGGGHDLSLPSIRALSRHVGQAVGGINLDAHLDVRSSTGSGMPFRHLIEGGHVAANRFVEYGLGRFANDAADLEWAAAQGVHLVFADQVLDATTVDGISPDATTRDTGSSLQELLGRTGDGPGFVSIDLDGIDQSLAPGVSAQNPLGLAVRHAARLAELAGKSPGIRHFDLMELCPAHDQSERTAKSAALIFLAFVAGFRDRPR